MMELSRHGAHANHGTKTKKIKTIKASWMPTASKLEVRAGSYVSDFNGTGTYQYYFRYDLKEVGQQIAALADRSADIPAAELREQMRQFVPDLIKLTNAISAA